MSFGDEKSTSINHHVEQSCRRSDHGRNTKKYKKHLGSAAAARKHAATTPYFFKKTIGVQRRRRCAIDRRTGQRQSPAARTKNSTNTNSRNRPPPPEPQQSRPSQTRTVSLTGNAVVSFSVTSGLFPPGSRPSSFKLVTAAAIYRLALSRVETETSRITIWIKAKKTVNYRPPATVGRGEGPFRGRMRCAAAQHFYEMNEI
jgi:hypothetical protein